MGEIGLSQGIPKAFWNDRFSEDGYAYGTRPSRLLMAWSPDLAQEGFSTALIPACGEGRDAVYLASLGLDVTAVDISSAGLAKTRQLAERYGVTVNTVEADLFAWDWPEAQFDVIAGMFAHMPSAVRPRLHALYEKALRPNGLICIEGFTKDQLSYQKIYQSGGPPDIDMLYDADSLRADFSTLEPLSLTTGIETLSEGPYHSGPAALLRAVFRKPIAS